jgi:hypothetical protein
VCVTSIAFGFEWGAPIRRESRSVVLVGTVCSDVYRVSGPSHLTPRVLASDAEPIRGSDLVEVIVR